MDMPPYLPNFSNEIQPPFGIQESEEDSPRTCIWAEPQPFLDVSRNKKAAEGSGKELPGLLGFFRLVWGIIGNFFGFELRRCSGFQDCSLVDFWAAAGQMAAASAVQTAVAGAEQMAAGAVSVCVCTHPSSTGHG
jgi:hypothetical protein